MPCLHAPHPAAHVSIWNSCNTYLCYHARQAAASNSMSDAGRTLYAVSRAAKANPNDADRFKKFLSSVARHRRHRGQTQAPANIQTKKNPTIAGRVFLYCV